MISTYSIRPFTRRLLTGLGPQKVGKYPTIFNQFYQVFLKEGLEGLKNVPESLLFHATGAERACHDQMLAEIAKPMALLMSCLF